MTYKTLCLQETKQYFRCVGCGNLLSINQFKRKRSKQGFQYFYTKCLRCRRDNLHF
ncbi:hypothetical protein PSE10B_55570 [Pseudomonas amygdali pv. eriobotryae]|nr:hypothetical protein PSE10B_55570 [Pseudomonas amygdali pv. eriobotryae]